MPLSLYMAVHVPIVVTESLRRRGLDVLTSQDDGTATQVDELLLARATELGRILFTQDQDFLRIAADWQREGRSLLGVVFAAQQGVSPAVWPTTWSSC
jgi:predicted nuclease of predicted toxin-antitoxin system